MGAADTGEAVAVTVEVEVEAVAEVRSFDPHSPIPSLMELTRSLVGGFTSSNSAPLGGGRRW